jgi:microcystin-dependent protein
MQNPGTAWPFYPNQRGELSQTSIVSAVPTGAMMPWALVSSPTGYLNCDGNFYNVSDYSDLYGTIGSTFGFNLSNNTFAVPDTRARQLFGDNGGANYTYFLSSFSTIGNYGGITRVNLTANNLPAHQHLQRLPTAYSAPVVGNPFPIPALTGAPLADFTGCNVLDANSNVVTQQPLIITQPLLTMNYIIKY